MKKAEQEKTPAQGIWCGKMCPELSAPTKEPISASCSKKPQRWPANKPPLFLSLKTDGLQPDALPMWEDNGALRGEYLMHSFGACPKDENASHLSQILEASPHPKYSLSAKACLGILNRAEKRGKQLPEILKLALIQQAQRGAYCIQGNCIDRADTAGCNGKGWTEGVSYTLNTIDRPAVLPFVPSPPQGDVVVFEPGSCSRVGGHIWQDGKAPALRAQSGDNQPAIALENHPADSRVKIAEDGIVQTLNARMGTGGGGMFPSLCVRSPVLEHSNAGATDVYPAGNKLQGSAGCNNGGTNVIMFENYQFANWRPGCGTLKASGGDYGGGSENLIVYQYWNGEQVTDTLTARNAGGAQRMPDKQNFNCVVGFHLPQDTITDENKTACPSAGSSTGEASLGVCEGQSQAQYIVRRLTPLECERLQGFPDGWTDIGEWTDSKGKVHKESTDSARYKALGNSIAIPPWTYVLQRLSLCCGAKPTMASLFDGIGGFPYIWESLNGKGSCVWASEIEDFPIAVTKYHFPEEVNDDG